MPSLKQLEEQGRALLADQKTLVEDDRRSWAQKRPEFDNRQKDIEAVLAQYRALKSVDGRGFGSYTSNPTDFSYSLHDGSDNGPFGARLKGLAAGVAAKGYRPVSAPQLDLTNEQTRELYDAAVSHKSLAVDTKTPDDSSTITVAGIPDYRLPPVTTRREPTRVLSLIPTFSTNNSTVEWFSTTGTTAAAATAEGATKPLSHIAYTAQTTKATKIAHYVEVTDETLSDYSGFLGVLETDMVAGLIKAENAELLNATVTGGSNFPGLLNTSGILTRARTTETNLDAIFESFDDLRVGTSFAMPDGIVMHPSTWGSTRRLKDSNGRYYLQPDPAASNELSIGGVPVVLTTQIATGTALIGSFAESTIAYVRWGIRVETANQGNAQFTANTTLVRAEERVVLTVPRPSGLIKLTNLV